MLGGDRESIELCKNVPKCLRSSARSMPSLWLGSLAARAATRPDAKSSHDFNRALVRLVVILAVLPCLMGAKGAIEAQLNEDLFLAALYGSADRVQQLLRQGANANAINPDDRSTPIMVAAQRDHVGVVSTLLAHGASVQEVDTLGYTPLMYATNAQIAKMLVDKGANVNVRGKDNQTPLLKASSKGAAEVTRILLSKGADVNAKGRKGQTALIMSIDNGYSEVAKVLLVHGADVNATDDQGRTALMCAASNKQPGILRMLLEKGADANVRSKIGYPALMYAGDDIAAVEILLEKGADVNARAEDGMTVLMRAAAKGYYPVVNLLLEKGADVNAQDKQGRGAFYWATKFGHVTIAELLKAHGAKEM